LLLSAEVFLVVDDDHDCGDWLLVDDVDRGC